MQRHNIKVLNFLRKRFYTKFCSEKNLKHTAIYIFFMIIIFWSNRVMTSIKRIRTLRTRSKRANASERISNACRTRFGTFERSERVLYPFVSTWVSKIHVVSPLCRFQKSIDSFRENSMCSIDSTSYSLNSSVKSFRKC